MEKEEISYLELENQQPYMVYQGQTVNLDKISTSNTGEIGKKEGKKLLKQNSKEIARLQDVLYANGRYALLIVFQSMDASGKDSTVKHVFSRVRPQGIEFSDFQKPASGELQHDYLWRLYKKLPGRGMIGIFHRSHYEEVVATRVHPDFILKQNLPHIRKLGDINEEFWHQRYNHINNFEQYLVENGIVVLKFFLHLSREKQSKRFLKRINRADKHWKFSVNDIKEQQYWEDYQFAYKKAIQSTSTDLAPWFVIPADHKWFTRYIISQVVLNTLKNLDLSYPSLDLHEQEIQDVKQNLKKQAAGK